MAKSMRRDASGFERRALLGGPPHRLIQAFFDSRPREAWPNRFSKMRALDSFGLWLSARFNSLAKGFNRGTVRSLRPLPWKQTTLGGPQRMSWGWSFKASETRAPVRS